MENNNDNVNDDNNNNNEINNDNVNNEILGGLPRRRVRDFDLNKEPTPSPQVSGNDDCHLTMVEVEEVQSDQVPVVVQTAMGGVEEVQSDQVPVVVQTAMGGVEEVQSDQVPVVQTEPSKDKGKRPMVSSEEAHDKVDDGGSAAVQENINIADADDQSSQPERKRQRSDSIKIRAPRVKVLIEAQDDPIEDGFRWRKYGQKCIKANKNQPRAYYRCSDKKCQIRKQVEKDCEDPRIMVITYEGRHNHEPPPPMNENAGAARARAKNATFRSRINRNYNYIPPMQLHPLHHHFQYHTYEHGNSSKGSSAYPSPAIPFPRVIPTPPAAALVNLNGCGTSRAPPAEECSNKVPENKEDDDKQNDI